jgi:hypothetical protein
MRRMKPRISKFWRIGLVLLLLYLLYQNKFSWSNDFNQIVDSVELQSKQVVLLSIKEHKFGVSRTPFASLTAGLKIYEYDKKAKIVTVKFDTLLPQKKTKIMVLYDRGFDSFEKTSEVFSVSTFPYAYDFQEKRLVSLNHVNEDGTLFLTYKDRKIRLKPNEEYWDWTLDNGFQIKVTIVKNNGIFDKTQFKAAEKQK